MKLSTWLYLARYSLGKFGALSAYRDAIKNQNKSIDEIEAISWEKVKKLLDLAYNNVAWYKNRYSALGLHPNDITRPEHFQQIPILTRTELVENYQSFISDKCEPSSLKISTTGGSTGTPLKIGMQKSGQRELPKWQMLNWWGLSPSENMATIYRGIPESGLKKLAMSVIQWPQKVIRLDATQITQQKIEAFIKFYRKNSPLIIHGYVGALDTIADYLLENSIRLSPPKVIWTTAAPLNEIQERKIETAFGAPVCDQYGCSEIYFIAAECPHKNGLHQFSDKVRLEIVNEQNQLVPNEEYGKIILTNLEDHHFPLIRYENGDRGRYLNHTCSCGINYPLIDKVKGRISDNITLPDGTVLTGEYLTTIFDHFTDLIKQFQLIQKKDSSIQINVVLNYSSDNNKQKIEKHIAQELGSRVANKTSLSVSFIKEINSKKGKLQFITKE